MGAFIAALAEIVKIQQPTVSLVLLAAWVMISLFQMENIFEKIDKMVMQSEKLESLYDDRTKEVNDMRVEFSQRLAGLEALMSHGLGNSKR